MRVGPFGITELLIILVVILLLFGAKRLPEIGSSLGKGMRTFKTAITGEDENPPKEGQSVASGSEEDRRSS
jgi:sec-independent protein translocase protein TatA